MPVAPRTYKNARNTYLQDSDWCGTWHTNAYFKMAKSEFAFHLHQRLSALPDSEAKRRFTVPKYIRDLVILTPTGADGGWRDLVPETGTFGL